MRIEDDGLEIEKGRKEVIERTESDRINKCGPRFRQVSQETPLIFALSIYTPSMPVYPGGLWWILSEQVLVLTQKMNELLHLGISDLYKPRC